MAAPTAVEAFRLTQEKLGEAIMCVETEDLEQARVQVRLAEFWLEHARDKLGDLTADRYVHDLS